MSNLTNRVAVVERIYRQHHKLYPTIEVSIMSPEEEKLTDEEIQKLHPRTRVFVMRPLDEESEEI